MMKFMETNREFILNDLLDQASKLGLVVIKRKLDSRLKPCISYQRKLIILNTNYHNQKQIILQLAHEIGHYVNGDSFGNEVLFSPAMSGYEGNANRVAIQLLLPYYLDDKSIENVNVADFMNFFSIPMSMETIVVKEIKNYFSNGTKNE